MRCRKCGEDIGGLRGLFTIYEGKKWCECKFIKDLIREAKKAGLKELEDWLNEGYSSPHETLEGFGVKLAKKIEEIKK